MSYRGSDERYSTIALFPELHALHCDADSCPSFAHVCIGTGVQRICRLHGRLHSYRMAPRHVLHSFNYEKKVYISRVVVGAGATTTACLLFAVIVPSTTYWAYAFVATVVSVMGADFVFAAGTLFIAKFALPHEQSVAGALFNTMMQVRSLKFFTHNSCS